MNVRIVLLAALVAVIGAGALLMCDDSDAATGDVLDEGSCGESATYRIISLNDANTRYRVEINGSGATYNYKNSTSGGTEPPWNISPYAKTKVYEVSISDGITQLGGGLFYKCTALITIDIPSNVTSLGNGVFRECTAVETITLHEGLTEISGYAFAYSKITTISIPSTVKTIGSYAFAGCTGLTQIEIPPGVEMINGWAFDSCINIKTATMPLIDPVAVGGASAGLTRLESITINAVGEAYTGSNRNILPQYVSRNTLKDITFPTDYIPVNSLYGLNLDTLTITNAIGEDVLGIFTAPGIRATAEDLTVTGKPAQIVRLTDFGGNAELSDGEITTDGATINWTITPESYGGETTASPDVLVYPAKVRVGTDSGMGVWMTTISILLVVGLIMSLILPMIARRLE